MNTVKNTEEKNIRIDRIINIIGCFGIAAGILVSILMNFVNRSLWYDEAMLAENFSRRSLNEILTLPPLNNQAPTIGYTFLTKLIVIIFGNSEFNLRLLSIIGFSAVCILAVIISKALDMRFYVLLGTCMANMTYLIKYSNQVKGYISEAACCLLCVLFFEIFRKKRDRKSLIILCCVFIASILIANPACFVIAGLIICDMVYGALKKDKKVMASDLIAGASSFSVFVIYYLFWLKTCNSNEMQDIWTGQFFAFSPANIETLIKNFEFFKILMISADSNYLLVIVSAAGLITAIKEKNITLCGIGLSFLIAVIASSFHLFPVSDRIWLFSYPLYMILVFYGIDIWIKYLSMKWKKIPKIVYELLCAVVLIMVVLNGKGIKTYINPDNVYWQGEEVNKLMEVIQENMTFNESVFVYYESAYAVKYHIGYDVDRFGKADTDNIIWSTGSAADPDNLKKDMDAIRDAGHCWIITSHLYEAQKNWQPLYDSLVASGDVQMYDFAGTYLFHFDVY